MTKNDAYNYARSYTRKHKEYRSISYVQLEEQMTKEGHTIEDIELVKEWIRHWSSGKSFATANKKRPNSRLG